MSVTVIELARAAELKIENGIRTNEFGQTSDSSVWAVGDCASFPFKSHRIRLESVQNVTDHAENFLGGSTTALSSGSYILVRAV